MELVTGIHEDQVMGTVLLGPRSVLQVKTDLGIVMPGQGPCKLLPPFVALLGVGRTFLLVVDEEYAGPQPPEQGVHLSHRVTLSVSHDVDLPESIHDYQGWLDILGLVNHLLVPFPETQEGVTGEVEDDGTWE